MKLYRESESIPKQIITEEYLFYFEWYSFEITSNLIHYQNCYIENLESKIYVGKKTLYNIIPVDVQGIIITNDETTFQTLSFSENLIKFWYFNYKRKIYILNQFIIVEMLNLV